MTYYSPHDSDSPATDSKGLDAYFRSGESWAADREAGRRSLLRLAWITAGVLGAVALAEAVAIAVMMPLKTVEPYTLLVDKQTGYVQALKPLDRETLAPDKALTRSFLAQYVLAREGFDAGSLRSDYRKVALWSAGEARSRYLAEMQATNPASPLARLPHGTIIDVEVRGITSLSNDTALVRFATLRTDPGGQAQPPEPWQAVIAWRFSSAAMSEADRFTNPLGFQVTRYRRNAEIPLDSPSRAVRQEESGAIGAPHVVAPSGMASPSAKVASTAQTQTRTQP